MVLIISRVNVWTIFAICVWYSPYNTCFLNTCRYIRNILLLIDVTAKSWYPSLFYSFNITPWTHSIYYSKNVWSYPSSYTSKNFGVWQWVFLWHRWLLPSPMSLLLQINSLLSKRSLSLLKFVYSLQNVSIVPCNSF